MTQNVQETKSDSIEDSKKVSKYSEDRKQIFTIPNILTYIRILCVPLFIAIYIIGMTRESQLYNMISLGVFLFASLTDIVDGKIARKFHMESDIGKAMDPLADKLLQVSVIVLLTVSQSIHWIYVLLIFAKEFCMVIGGILLTRRNIVPKANIWGKIAAFLLGIGIIIAFFVDVNTIFVYLTNAVLIAAVVITYYAAIQYAIVSVRAYKIHLKQGNEERVYFEHDKSKKIDEK